MTNNEKEQFKLKLNIYVSDNYIVENQPDDLLSGTYCGLAETLVVPEEEKEAPSKSQINGYRRKVKRIESEEKAPLYLCSVSPDIELEPTFQEKLLGLIDQSCLSDPDIYKASNIDKRLFSKIRSNKYYNPSKNTVIQFCFGLKLEIDTALDLLQSAGYTLSFSVLSDVIIRFYLEEKNYDLMDLNITLYEHDLKPLFL